MYNNDNKKKFNDWMHDIDCFNWMFEYFSILFQNFMVIIIYLPL